MRMRSGQIGFRKSISHQANLLWKAAGGRAWNVHGLVKELSLQEKNWSENPMV
jgi:hypothetical protein